MRRILQIFWAAFVGVIVLPVLGSFFSEWAKELGWYQRPSAHVEMVMNWLVGIGSHPAYLILASLICGLGLGTGAAEPVVHSSRQQIKKAIGAEKIDAADRPVHAVKRN